MTTDGWLFLLPKVISAGLLMSELLCSATAASADFDKFVPAQSPEAQFNDLLTAELMRLGSANQTAAANNSSERPSLKSNLTSNATGVEALTQLFALCVT